MRILIIATKAPWPPRDGGRLALWLTMQGLAAAGHALALVAPVDRAADAVDLDMLRSVGEPHLLPLPAHGWLRSLPTAVLQRQAVTVVRHRHAAVRARVAALLADWQPDIVHVEQLQAFAHAVPAAAAGVPVLLRMQNVESDLWQRAGGPRARAIALQVEAARLRRAEAIAMQTARRVVALTDDDARRLRQIAPAAAARIHAVPPPFPQRLPTSARVPGEPAVVLAGSGGWRPNRDGLRWFLHAVCGPLRQACPGARVHVFGPDGVAVDGVDLHPAPADATDAFPAGAIVAIPLFTASGIRMRILDAWARGLPVVATTVAAAGLQAVDGEQLLLADTAAAFSAAIGRLHADPALRERLVAGGREHLRRRHDPAALASALDRHYRDCIAGAGR